MKLSKWENFVICEVCGKKFLRITSSHLKKYHNLTFKEYRKRYPNSTLDSNIVKRKLSKRNLGKTFPESKYPNHGMRGKKHKEETKRKISEKEGRGERISKALKGRKKSEEHKRKLRKSAKERFKDKRERKKMSFRSSISQILKKINDPFGWFLWKYNIEKGMQKYRGDNNPSKRPEVRKKISKNNSMKNSIYRKKSRLGLIKALKGVDRSGDKNSNWRGGTSKEPYPFLFNEILKNKVKERDDFTCRLCGSKKHLAIHHINYDKDDINIDNLVTLCFTCNSRMNGKREFWKNFWRNQYER